MTPINPLPEDVAVATMPVGREFAGMPMRRSCSRRWRRFTPGSPECTDSQAGRIIDYLEQTGQLENTIVFYCRQRRLPRVRPTAQWNENKFFNGYPDGLSENAKYLNTLGSPDTYNHYPTGWAVGFSTPFQMFKPATQPVRRRHLRSDGDLLAEGHQGPR